MKPRSVSSNEKGFSNNSKKNMEEFKDLNEVDGERPFDERCVTILTNEVLRHTEGRGFNDKRKNPLVMMWRASKAEMDQRETVRRRVEEKLKKGLGGMGKRSLFICLFVCLLVCFIYDRW
jgi:hypothetical protein